MFGTKFNPLFLTCIMISIFYTGNVIALVDYDDSNSSFNRGSDPRSGGPVLQKRLNRKPRPTRQTSKSQTKFINLDLKYDSMDVKTSKSGDVSSLILDGRFQTQYNIFTDFSYRLISSSDTSITNNSTFQEGNPSLKLGFNWLRVGEGPDSARVDLYGGMSFRASKSDFGSSRNDKIFGIETTKRIYEFVVGIGAEMRITGAPKDENELNIGNIRILSFGLGWVVSHDIRFSLEAMTVKIGASNATDIVKKLNNAISFSSLTPKLFLSITPMIELELGTNIRTKRAKDNEDILAAQVFDLPGSYGSSIFTGLNISI